MENPETSGASEREPVRLVAREHQTRGGARHLRVRQNRFDAELKPALQRVGSPARWLPGAQEWDYPLTPAAVVALQDAADRHGAVIEWQGELQEFARRHLDLVARDREIRKAIERFIRDASLVLPPYPTRVALDNGRPVPPLRHQQIAFHWALRASAILLAWDPGTGKTRAAVDALGGWYRYGVVRPMQAVVREGKPGVVGGVLVVCPKSVIPVWEREIRLWQNAALVSIQGDPEKKRALAGTAAHVHIVNYQSLKYVEHNAYDGLILDEIHACANHTEQTKRVLLLASHTVRRLGLSGTPLSNGLESIFYPMLILDGGLSLGSSKTAFLERYFHIRRMPNYTINTPKASAVEEVAKAISTTTYWVRKEEVLDLPEKTFTPIYVPMTAEQRRYYEQLRRELIAYIQNASVTVDQAASRMMKLMQVCQGFVLADDGSERLFSSAKLDALLEVLTTSLAGRKVLVWAYFLSEIRRLCQVLSDAHIPFLAADGSVSSAKVREEQVKAFNERDDILVFVRQLSLSEGLTLLGTPNNPCSNAIYAGLNYRYVDWMQSQDRIHRIGQRFPCSYTILLTENGVDRAVYERVLSKQTLVDEVEMTSKEYYLKLLHDTP